MFCSACGTKIEEKVNFCQSCGTKIGSSGAISVNDSNTKQSGVKNYSSIFWKYFWIGVVLNIFSRGVENSDSTAFWVLFLIFVGIYIYKFSETINEAMSAIGKKNWGWLGIIALVPFGFWVAFLIVRSKLKPHGMWVSQHSSFKLSKKL